MRKFGVAIFPDERVASNGELTEHGTTIDAPVLVFSARSLRQGTSLARNCGEVGWLGCPRAPAAAVGATGGALIGLLRS